LSIDGKPAKQLESSGTSRQLDFLEFLEAVVRIALASAVADVNAAAVNDQRAHSALGTQSNAQQHRRGSFGGGDVSLSRRGSFTDAERRVQRGSFDGANSNLSSRRSSINDQPSATQQQELLAQRMLNEEYDAEANEYIQQALCRDVAIPPSRVNKSDGHSVPSGGLPINGLPGLNNGVSQVTTIESQSYEIRLDIPLHVVTEKLSNIIHQLTKHKNAKKLEKGGHT
jgi:hypothetical protein